MTHAPDPKKDGGLYHPGNRLEKYMPGTRFEDDRYVDYPGITLRDWFAGQALIGFTNAFVSSGWLNPNEFQIDALVKSSYVAADAMIAAREGRS